MQVASDITRSKEMMQNSGPTSAATLPTTSNGNSSNSSLQQAESESSWSENDECSPIGSQLRAIWNSKKKKKKKKNSKKSKNCKSSPCCEEEEEPQSQSQSPQSQSLPPPPRILLNHSERQLQKLESLYASLKAIAQSQPTNQTILVSHLLEQALLLQPKHAALKQWVEIQQRIYNGGFMPKSQKMALRQAGIMLKARRRNNFSTFVQPQPQQPQDDKDDENLPSSCSTSTTPALLVVKQQDGTIDKYFVDPEEIGQYLSSTDAATKKNPTPLKREADCGIAKKRKRNQDDHGTTATTPSSSSKKKKKQQHQQERAKSTGTTTSNNSSFRASPSEAAKRKRKRPPTTCNPRVGDTIWVLYKEDDWWFPATIVSTKQFSARYNVPQGSLLIQWKDGGSQDEVDVAKDVWGVDNDQNANYNIQKEQQVACLKINSQLSIYWPNEGQHYKGTLMEQRMLDYATTTCHNEKPHFIVYEDGEDEWTNLHHRRFTILDDD